MIDNRSVDVLLVDDSPSDVELTIHVLRHNKLANSIHVAEDGKEALDFLFCRGEHQGRSITDRPRVILLDLTIPVVILTSSKEQKDLIEGYRIGASAFIQKPVDFGEFQNAIKEIGLFWLVVNEPPPADAFTVV
jgi:CheY-like chemotaxis protein